MFLLSTGGPLPLHASFLNRGGKKNEKKKIGAVLRRVPVSGVSTFPSSYVRRYPYDVRFLVGASLAPASVAVYLASVRSLHLEYGFDDPTVATPRLRRVLKGIRRSSSHVHSHRLPITKVILRSLHAQLSVVPSDVHTTMFWAACCLAFFGFCVSASSPLEVHSSRPVICPWPTLRFPPVLPRPPSGYD